MLTNNLGLSGSNLEIIGSIVRKTSPKSSYNNRLLKQVEKQNFFSKLTFTYISTPLILSKGDDYFDMEYLNAKRFDDFLYTAEPNYVNLLIKAFDEYLSFLISTSKTQNAEAKIKSKLKDLKLLSSHKNFIDYLLELEIDLTSLPYGFCHGDLTLTNILFSEKKIYFIDFLDTYVDSYLIDLTKLKQDFYYNWASKIFGLKDMKPYQFKKYVWSQLESKYNAVLNSKQFHLLDAINLLRIEPYVNSSEQKMVLSEIIKKTYYYKKFLLTQI